MANKKKNDNVIPIRDLIFYCLRKWYWFVISLAIAMCVAVYQIKSTPPQYLRYAEVLIKEGEQRGGAGTGSTFKELGSSRTTADAENEITALQSVEIMKEAIRRLALDVEFKGEGRFYNGIIYKDRPLKIKTLDLGESDRATFTAVITSDSTVLLKDFTFNGEILGNDALTATIGKLTPTPIGKIAIESTENLNIFKDTELYIEKHNIDMLANALCSRLSASITKGTI